MDAAEDNNDVKLYKASGNLIASLEEKLPRLLHKPQGEAAGPIRIRHYVLLSQYDEVNRIVSTRGKIDDE